MIMKVIVQHCIVTLSIWLLWKYMETAALAGISVLMQRPTLTVKVISSSGMKPDVNKKNLLEEHRKIV